MSFCGLNERFKPEFLTVRQVQKTAVPVRAPTQNLRGDFTIFVEKLALLGRLMLELPAARMSIGNFCETFFRINFGGRPVQECQLLSQFYVNLQHRIHFLSEKVIII